MTTQQQTALTTPDNLTAERVDTFRRDGFVHVPNIISKEEAARFHDAALNIVETRESRAQDGVFSQHVNVWEYDPTMRELTRHPNVARVAEALTGVQLRLWHDQILAKKPHNNVATEFHQDQPYWPHDNSPNPISAWIALCDVPVERGCMTFLPGSHRRTDLAAQNLRDAESLFTICPDLRWSPRVTLPLRAGDCTFHHGRCAHMATPNFTDQTRVAHVVIYIDATTTFSGKGHVCTNDLDLTPGQLLEGERFPLAVEG
ncbi:MAG: phytanoyl-CoA dioxygenase family protein [Phycisphaeraceae bacterium]